MNSILSVKQIVESVEEPVIVVVSALGGITDKLLKTAAMATNGDVGYEREFSEIITRHLDVIQGVLPDKVQRIEVQKQVMALLDELGNIYRGVYLINDLSVKTSDTIVSYGERISSLIVSNVIKDAQLFDSRKFIKTVKQFNKHIVDFDVTNQLIEETFNPTAQSGARSRFYLFKHRGRSDQSGAWRFGLYGCHLGGSAGRTTVGNLD